MVLSEELRTPGMTFAPRALPDLMSRLHAEGVPDEPIRIDGF